MNKLFTKIAGSIIGMAMAIGVGVAVGRGEVRQAKAANTKTETITFSEFGWGNGTAQTSCTGTYVSLTFAQGTNQNNAPKYYNTGSGIRLYANNTLTVNVTHSTYKYVTNISFNYASGYTMGDASSNVGIYSADSGSLGTWAYSTGITSVTFTSAGTCRLQSMEFTLADAQTLTPELLLDKSSINVSVGEDSSFVVTSANLTNNFTITGGNDSFFTASFTPSTTNGDHVVTLHGIATTTSPIVLTIASTGAESKTINVSVVAAVYYEKVLAASSLKAGKEIIVGTTDGTNLLGKYNTGNNCPALANVPNSQGKLIETNLPNNCAILTLGGEAGAWTLTDQSSKIYFGTADNNYLKSSDDSTDTWSISISNNGVATITSAASGRMIGKNNSSSIISTYESSSSYREDVSIYMIPSLDPELQVLLTGSTSLGVGETATLSTNKLNGASGTVSWTSSNNSALSLSASTGDSVIVTAGSVLGTATITASLAGCDSVITSFTVRRGSLAEPYTIAQAISAINGSDAAAKTNVYVSGIISQVDSLNDDNSITYWISDNGLTTTQMEVYKGFGLDSAAFTAADDLQVGDEVVVYGSLKKYTPNNADPIYEFNSGSHLQSFNRPVKTLAAITEISGTLTADAGDLAWDLSGLTVMGTFSGSADVVDVTMFVNLTTEDVPGTPATTTVRNVSVTATGKDDNTITHTNNVQGTINVVSGLIANGNYRIKATRDSVTYYLKENSTSSAPSAVTNFWEATIFTFTLIDDDTYTISNGDNYLYATATNNGVRFGVPQTATNKNWILEAGEGTLEGTYNLKTADNNRYLTLYAATDANPSDWRGYNSATASNRKENTDLQAFDAVQYATEFLNTYTAGCIADGGYVAENMKWNTASSQFGALSTFEQNILKAAEYTKTGSGSNTVVTAGAGVNQIVAEAAARYDYIVSTHGTGTFADFMVRLSNGSNIIYPVLSSNKTSIIIVVISCASLLAVGAFLFLKNVKNNN